MKIIKRYVKTCAVDAARLEIKVVLSSLLKAGITLQCKPQKAQQYKTSPVLFHMEGVKASVAIDTL